jgi:hypothetical protein
MVATKIRGKEDAVAECGSAWSGGNTAKGRGVE